jgi:hypothetical protein
VRLQIRQPDGAQQTVELEQHINVLGRDPGCDVVLRGPKCSRRHAVLESTPLGLLLRDSGSANGLFVNGQRVDRTLLHPGDVIRVGEATVVLLSENATDRDELVGPGAENATPPETHAPLAPALSRPLAINTLAAIWVLSGPLALLLAGRHVAHAGRIDVSSVLLLLGGILAVLLAWALAIGLLAGARWARALHLLLCIPLALTCLLAPPALVAAAYLLGDHTRRHFARRDASSLARPSPSDARIDRLFATALAGATLLSVLLTVATAVALRGSRATGEDVRHPPAIESVLARMRAMRAAQESFRGVCNVGFADLEALTSPATVLPGYRPDGPPFLPPEQAKAEADGYRFRLAIGGLMGPAADCSTLRRYRVFEYTATPLDGRGPHFLLAGDGIIREAEDRPAQRDDPPVQPER